VAKKLTRLRIWLVAFGCLALAFLFSGCQTLSYYRQAIAGQYQILSHQKAIRELIEDPATSPDLKAKFQLVLKLRQFAENEMHLPANGHYLKYVDLHRPYVVWNVYAAPALSLEPKTWWFPIVGRASYRGYFSEKNAQKYGQKMERENLDVYVSGIETYSTLGWFRDPLLNTFIHEPESGLAEIIFHELGHQRLFISGDTDFNEAFATAVAEESLRRWYEKQHDKEAYERFLRQIQRKDDFVQLIAATRNELEALYNDPHISDANKLQRKKKIIEQLRLNHQRLKAKWGGKSPYADWFAEPINNAKLNTVAAYYDLVPAFHALLKENGGDVEKFYSAVRQISKLSKEKRKAKMDSLLKKATGTSLRE